MNFRIDLITSGMNPHALLSSINALFQQLSPGKPEIDFSRLSDAVRHSYLFVAFDGEKVIGMATLSISMKLEGKEGHVDDVVIDEAHQGRGLGRLLMEKLIEYAKRNNVKSILLTSRPSRKRANKLYPNLGFVLRNRETNLYCLIL